MSYLLISYVNTIIVQVLYIVKCFLQVFKENINFFIKVRYIYCNQAIHQYFKL
nr:MAG TPA: hypothetical protein [Caudoviricetes sp.]